MKKCPFCAEEIQDEAIKCRFCNEFIEEQTNDIAKRKKSGWYFKTSTIVVSFLFVGPLVLPLVWLNPQYSRKKKIIYSLILMGITVLLYKVLKTSMTSIDEYYSVIQGNY